METIRKLPFFVILAGIGAIAMLVPAAHAVRLDDYFTARVFLQSGVLFFLFVALIAIAMLNYAPRDTARSHLIALLGALVVLPAMLAYPVAQIVPGYRYFDLYFEMLSCLTTTGATVFDTPALLPEPLHLWRAFVAWLGGFLIIVSAIATLAPLNLGGFEVYAGSGTRDDLQGAGRIQAADVSARLLSFSRQLAPVYLAITLVLAILLVLSGERVFVAAIHAMSTISTSGISVQGGLATAHGGFVGEVFIFVFLLFAVSRVTFSFENGLPSLKELLGDHEFRLMLALVTSIPLLLFLRHWFAAFDSEGQQDLASALAALWGAIFTVLSFLTTTGFESASWSTAQHWSGVEAPGLLLFLLATMGGGVATTAGGIKLLRVYALYRHGQRELQRLNYPSSVAGAGGAARHIRREGAYVAWMYFMLFAVSTALVMLALTLTGLSFEVSLTYAIAALSTTGPLPHAVLDSGASYAALDDWAKAVLAAAMVVGRLEILAIVALLNPEFWRR